MMDTETGRTAGAPVPDPRPSTTGAPPTAPVTTPATPRQRALSRAAAGLVVVVTVLLAVYTALSLVTEAPKPAVVMPLAVVGALALTTLAITSIETFVLVVLALRASLDAVKLGQGSGAAADPSVFLVALLVVVTIAWIAAQDPAERQPLSRLSAASLVFGAAALVGVLVSPDPATSLVEWARIAAVILMLVLVERLAVSREFSRRVVVAIYLSAALPLIVAFTQMVTGEGVFQAGGFDRVTGTFTHSNPFAAYVSILLVGAFAFAVTTPERRRRTIFAVIAGVLGIALLATYTRGAWIATFVGILTILWFHRRQLVLPIAAGAVVVGLLLPGVADRFSDLDSTGSTSGSENSLSWRLEYWQDALELGEGGNPIVGIGLKQVAEQLPEEKQPHNDYLRAYVELGVVGLAAYIWFFVAMVLTARSAVRATRGLRDRTYDRGFAMAISGIAAALIVMSIVANLMSQVAVLWYAMAFAGLAVGVLARRAPAER